MNSQIQRGAVSPPLALVQRQKSSAGNVTFVVTSMPQTMLLTTDVTTIVNWMQKTLPDMRYLTSKVGTVKGAAYMISMPHMPSAVEMTLQIAM